MPIQRLLPFLLGLLLAVSLTHPPSAYPSTHLPNCCAEASYHSSTPPPLHPILQTEGRLESTDSRFEAGSFYDEYQFNGDAGQQITITVESLEFDPSLRLNDAQNNEVDYNDDIDDSNYNASLTLKLPQTGSYRIWVSSPDAATGRYQLTVIPSQPGAQPQLSPAAERQIEARRQWRQAEEQRQQGQLEEALQGFQQALHVYQQTGNRSLEAGTLNMLGLVYEELSRYPEAIEILTQAITLQRTLGNQSGESVALNNLGIVYSSMGQYAKALATYQQALELARQDPDQDISYEGEVLGSQATILFYLGQYQQALTVLEQALTLQQNSPIGIITIGNTLNQIGLVYNRLEKYDLSLEYLKESVSLQQKTGNRTGEGIALSNLGSVHANQGNYQLALTYHQQALAIHRQTGNLASAAATLNNLARVYENLQQPDRAIAEYQQALQIAEQIGDRYGISVIYNNLGFLLGHQAQPELAIALLKYSVNQWEAIRSELTPLSIEQQQSFTDSVASTYRYLADLLLQQDRILEAQQVLDLLKIQELNDYLKDAARDAQIAIGLILWPAEQQILNLYRQQNISADSLDHSLTQFFDQAELQTQVEELRRITREQRLNPDLLIRLQNNLKGISQTAALLYPLVLEDRLELILVRPNAAPVRQSVAVSRPQLEQTIIQFRTELTQRVPAQTAAQQLYDWLIRPLATELSQTETILFATDGRLRYVPLAALHDGNQWLIQQFQINYITAASLTDFSSQRPLNPTVLAGAFSDPERVYQFAVGAQNYRLAGLKYAGLEVSAIAAELPTTALLNQEFSKTAVEAEMNRHQIVHLATHAELVSGNPNESFILFGNGDRVTLGEISDWTMPAVDLVVLSACRTAVGEQLGNGEEILGFGYQIQRTGAKAALASLWYVDDSGTQTLMNEFYAALSQGKSKAAALRQAQLAMITESPYYWAPFILIGNGL